MKKKRKKVRKSDFVQVEFTREEICELLEKIREKLGEDAYQKFKTLFDAYETLTNLIRDHGATIRELRRLLFGASTETQENLFPKEKNKEDKKTPKKKPKGHGRNGADNFPGAKKVDVDLKDLKPGQTCPDCGKGKVYEQNRGVLLRFSGQPPVQVTIFRLQKLRCNLCGAIFTADHPKEAGKEKYDATTGAMVGLLKYGSGMPFNRLQALQGIMGVPLPGSTQWEIVFQAAEKLKYLYQEMIRQAAQGKVLHNDDTTMKVLSLAKKRQEKKAQAKGKKSDGKERKGSFTTGVVSIKDGRKITLFFTGANHAGENMSKVLKERAEELPPPIQMCDALSRNLPEDFQVILANCLSHGRRNFVKQLEKFPDQVKYVIQLLGKVYAEDTYCREQGVINEERLAWHQEKSKPIMDELENWMAAQLEEKKVEPNSGLGKAITYMQDHWDALTLFLQVPGAPLDNNICERAIKKAILHRKNAYFYKTETGAETGDIFMSLIYTAQESGVNVYEYLTQALSHPDELASHPENWMPWNFPKA